MSAPSVPEGEHLALVDLVDRLMAGGVVLTGEVILSVAGVDLVYLGIRLLLSSVDSLAIQAGQPVTSSERT
jgi:hypothetical protein